MKTYLTIFLTLVLVLMSVLPVAAEDVDEKTGEALLELTGGDLRIITDRDGQFADIAGSSVDFGRHDLGAIGGDTYTGPNVGVVVQDARGYGSGSNWQISLTLGSFNLLDDEGERTDIETLLGSALILTPSGTVVPGSGNVPQAKEITLDPGRAGAPLFASHANGSAGAWGANWKPELEVPESAEAGSHQATLLWTLAAVA